MTASTRATNKGRFEDGDTPQGSDYADLIDSFLSLADTTAQAVTSDIITPKIIATTEVSSPLISTTEVSASVGSFSEMTITGVVSASSANFHDVVTSAFQATGPIKGGTAGAVGFMVLTQQSTVLATQTTNTTVAVVPDNSDVLDIYMFVKEAFATAAADVEVRVGVSANETMFGTFKFDSSAQILPGMHKLQEATAGVVSAATDWTALVGTSAKIMAQVTAVSGAIASGAEGILSIVYVQK